MYILDNEERIKTVRGWINFFLFFYILVTIAFGLQLDALMIVRPIETAKAVKDLSGRIDGGILPYQIHPFGDDQILIVGFSDSCPQINFKAYYRYDYVFNSELHRYDLNLTLLSLETIPLLYQFGGCV